MQRIVRIESVQQMGMLSDGSVSALPAEDFALHKPDLHLAIMDEGALTSRLSIWWKHGPQLEGQKVGAIGHYAAGSDAAATAVLDEACRVLASNGMARVVGPMNGSLWRRHRFITSRGDYPQFFLEPENPDAYPLQFEAAGFQPFLRSTSSIVDDLTAPDERAEEIAQTLKGRQVIIRPIDLQKFEQELGAIHALVSHHFDEHPLYSPMSKQAFIDKHLRARSTILPDLTLLAEVDGKLVGFIFAVPDLLQERRGHEIDTLVVRTLASAPERRYAGLGRLLLAQVHTRAADRGFRHVIHALLPESSHWESLGQRSARIIRQYAIFLRELPR